MAPWFLRNSDGAYLDIGGGFVKEKTWDCIVYVVAVNSDASTIHNTKHVYVTESLGHTRDPQAAGLFAVNDDLISFGSCVLTKEHVIFNNIDLTFHGLHIERNGYTVIEKYVSEAVVDEIKTKLNLPETSQHQVRNGALLEMDPIFGKMLKDSTVLSIVQMFLENEVKCATWSSNTLYKEDSDSYRPHWHVDFPYHDIPSSCWTPSLALSTQVLWLLDDFTNENGGTFIVPGSHKFQTGPTDLNMVGKEVDIVQYPKGSVVISHGAWWHSQGCNTTSKSRSCILGTYVQKWLSSKDDLVSQYDKMGYVDEMLRAVL